MPKVDDKVKADDLPADVEVDDFCTFRVNREAGTVELYSVDLEVMDAEGRARGTISAAGAPLCSIPLGKFIWTYVAPPSSRFAASAPDLCTECSRLKAACVCPPEPDVAVENLEEAERLKSARAKGRAA